MIVRRYQLTKLALKDLENIWVYTLQHWSLNQANRYYALILEEIEHTAKNFETSRPVDHILPGFRACRVKSHVIFFKLNEDNQILVVRILHHKMDIKTQLGRQS